MNLCLLCLLARSPTSFFVFFFNDTATTEIYTLSLHDALPIFGEPNFGKTWTLLRLAVIARLSGRRVIYRSEEHTSELQSQSNLVCRLLLEKKNNPLRQTAVTTLFWPYPRAHSIRCYLLPTTH